MEDSKVPYAIVIQSNSDKIPNVEIPETWADEVTIHYTENGEEKFEMIDKQEIIDEKIARAKMGIYRIESLAGFLMRKYSHIYLIPQGKSVVIDDDITK